MPLLTLSAEIREQILAYCVVQESFEWWWGPEYDRRRGINYPVYDSPNPVEEAPPSPPSLNPPDNQDTAPDTEEYVSELWQAKGEIDTEALAFSVQMEKRQKKYRTFSVLFTCRKLYQEAIPMFYRSNLFNFACVGDLKLFQKRAYEMGNHGYVRRIRIRLRCEVSMHYRHHVAEWEEFFEKEDTGLLWYFPGLIYLALDFEKKKDISSCPPRGRHCLDVGSFRETLKRTINLPKVEVWGIEDDSLVKGMERELSGP